MLASHTAGIPRESYSTGFNMVLSTGKADAPTIGAAWAGESAKDVIDGIATRNLMFAPGQRAAYSNAGLGLLGAAVATYYNNATSSFLTWSELVTQELLQHLNMTHSFFGTVPQDLIPNISIPGGDNWADLIVGEGYDPAAGMWSSANDLANYLHRLWLTSEPTLITPFQRRQVMKPSVILPDGKQQTGPGWEIEILNLPTAENASLAEGSMKTYSIFGKSGDGGGWHSWIDTIPNLGYGIIVLTQQSGLPDYTSISTGSIRAAVHDIMAPAFTEALSDRTKERYAGFYSAGEDTGLIADEVVTALSNSSATYANLEVQDQILYLRSLTVNGSSALEAIDRLSWTADVQPRYFSTPEGVVLEPAEGAGETAEFGPNSQVWRMIFPGLATCDWFDFDGYQDSNGWPLSKVVLLETDSGMELHYPPFDIIVSRMRIHK
jgi:CubicO group peptidase (beta-lactamase class C family)